MWETRIYLVFKSDTINRPYQMLFDEFVKIAESEGTVYSVPSFLTALDNGAIHIVKYYMRCGLVKDGKVIKELRR